MPGMPGMPEINPNHAFLIGFSIINPIHFGGTPIYGTLLRSESDSRTGFFPPEAPHLLPELSKCLRILPHHNDTGGPRISFIRQLH
jgi:hypothetical protein